MARHLSRAVKGGRFKICCFGFVSSNLTDDIVLLVGSSTPPNPVLVGLVSVSSVGRASVLSTVGQRFNPVTENYPSGVYMSYFITALGYKSATLKATCNRGDDYRHYDHGIHL
jgi:hypothetical protein